MNDQIAELQAKLATVEAALHHSNARFRTAMDAVSGVLWTCDPQGGFAEEQPSWERLTGQTRAQYQGWGWGAVIHPDDLERVKAIWQTSLDTGVPYDTEYRMHNRLGEYRTYSAIARPVLNQDGSVLEWVGVQTDIDDQRKAEAALRRSEDHSRKIVECNSMLMWLNDSGGSLQSMNKAFREFTGSQLPDFNFEDAVHPDDREIRKTSRLSIRSGTRYDAEFRMRSASGAYRWLHSSVTPLFDANGDIFAWVGSAIDIDDRITNRLRMKEELETNKLLLDELNHRVRNTLAIINSMVRSTIKQSSTMQDFQKTFEGRLYGLSAAHDILVAEKWRGAYLGDIIRAELRPIIGEIRWSMPCIDLVLTATNAVAIAMLIHELATNAVQHGAWSAPGGFVEVTWSVGDDRLFFFWTEKGGPTISAPTKNGFGSRLIAGIGKQLLGESRPIYDPSGLVFTLDFPYTKAIVNGDRGTSDEF